MVYQGNAYLNALEEEGCPADLNQSPKLALIYVWNSYDLHLKK
jgi:hypothetical protein